MATGLVLSLFPGLDGLGQGFEQMEWCVVKGPDLLSDGRDVRDWPLPPRGSFDGIIGGPPCQAFSKARPHDAQARQGNLIPEFVRVVDHVQPRWYLSENVPQAPEVRVPGYNVEVFVLNALDYCPHGEAPQTRRRRFCYGVRADLPFVPLGLEPRGDRNVPEFCRLPTMCNERKNVPHGRLGTVTRKMGRRPTWREMLRIQGFDPDKRPQSWTVVALQQAAANAVPVYIGRLLAGAIRLAHWHPEMLER